MRTLYLQCNMGAAGDMLMAALLELHPDAEGFLERFCSLQIPGVEIAAGPSVKCGITGTHVSITVDGIEEESHDYVQEHHHDHEHSHNHDHTHEHHHSHHHDHTHEHSHEHTHHHHTGMAQVEEILSNLPVEENVRENAKAVYRLIAEAESHAHGKPVDQIHFHEVGTMDAIADVTGVCMLIDELAVDQIVASPIHVGSGQVRCAHGILPVPAPATAYILRDVPVYGGSIQGELCTPTGAALLKHFVSRFGDMPIMRVEKIGYGMGKKDFEAANCVRALLGECEMQMPDIHELCCNLDDMTPEEVAYATELLMKEGALDVYTTNIQMKKNRPGIMLTCMCRKEDKEKFLKLIFTHTTTLGIREYTCNRYGLSRTHYTKETSYGTVHYKVSEGYGVHKEKFEYEDVARIAREQKISLSEVKKKISV